MRAVTDLTVKKWFSIVYSELHCYEHFKTLFAKILWNCPGSDAPLVKKNLPDKMANPLRHFRSANVAANLPTAMLDGVRLGGSIEVAIPKCHSQILD